MGYFVYAGIFTWIGEASLFFFSISGWSLLTCGLVVF
jgi:hypothetical protein